MNNSGEHFSDDGAERSLARCSFCLGTSRELRNLFEGSSCGELAAFYICHQCVGLCVLIFKSDKEAMLANENDDTESSSDAAAREKLQAKIDQVFRTLTYRERELVKLRSGLGDGYKYTLEDVRQTFNLTPARAREIEARAITKLTDNLGALRQNDEHPPWNPPRLYVEPDGPPP